VNVYFFKDENAIRINVIIEIAKIGSLITTYQSVVKTTGFKLINNKIAIFSILLRLLYSDLIQTIDSKKREKFKNKE